MDELGLDGWLIDHNMSTVEFSKIVGCRRQIIWKVKRGMTVSPDVAEKIKFATGGNVIPVSQSVGRPSYKHFHMVKKSENTNI